MYYIVAHLFQQLVYNTKFHLYRFKAQESDLFDQLIAKATVFREERGHHTETQGTTCCHSVPTRPQWCVHLHESWVAHICLLNGQCALDAPDLSRNQCAPAFSRATVLWAIRSIWFLLFPVSTVIDPACIFHHLVHKPLLCTMESEVCMYWIVANNVCL